MTGGNGETGEPQLSKLPDEAPPAASGTLFLHQFLIHWQHGDDGSVILFLTPVVQLPESIGGGFTITAPGQIGVRMGPELFREFQRDVARGGHSSPIAVPRQIGQEWRGKGKR